MKPAIAILAVFAATFAVPWVGLSKARKAWIAGRRKSSTGHCGAVFAVLLLRRAGGKQLRVVEGGRLFYEKFAVSVREIRLSRAVHGGRHLSALAWAALQAGMALEHEVRSRPMARLTSWHCAMRVLVNILPLLVLLLLFRPASWRVAPLLVLPCLFIAAMQILTFPAVRAAAATAREIVHTHQLLPPEEMEEFNGALKGAAERHLAAPLLDCFWLAWMLRF
ncbi:MAG: zinc metallopeptidase [Puniceicoccales bacterium]|jgi:Zn-dependent membrane protease YugP|nr:zinc metallopeptidase [Puniceicoccales bacterium]